MRPIHQLSSRPDTSSRTTVPSQHAIEKVGIPDRILIKPGRFEPQEFEIMKTHTTLGIASNAIPLPARLMVAADGYDALISRRVYKDGMPHEKAVTIIAKGT